MLRTWATLGVLCMAVVAANAVELKYAPSAGTKNTYKVTISGSMDVEGLGPGMFTDGRGEASETAGEAKADGTLASTVEVAKGYLSAGGAYISSSMVKKPLSVTRNARGIILTAEGAGIDRAGEDPILLALALATSVPLPEGAVEKGATWSAEHSALRPDGQSVTVTGEAKLEEVKDDAGKQIAVISSKTTYPALLVFNSPLLGDLTVEATTEVLVDTGVRRSVKAKISGAMATDATALQPLKIAFNPLEVAVELLPPK